MQTDLFGHEATDEVPIARNTDPWTSHKAAREYLESNHRDHVHRKIIHHLLHAPHRPGRVPEFTASEIDSLAGVKRAHKRMPELERKGLVERSEARKCGVTGKTCQTWRLT